MSAKSGPKPDMREIEERLFRLRERLDVAAGVIAAYDDAIAPIRAKYAAKIRRSAEEIRVAREAVAELVRAAPGLFQAPKSRVVHGIKVGLRKGPDRWAWPAEDALVALICERCTPEQQQAYLGTTTVGRKDAIPPEERARLGIGCTPGMDAVVIEEQQTNTAAALLALLSTLPDEGDGLPAGKAGATARARR